VVDVASNDGFSSCLDLFVCVCVSLSVGIIT